VEQSAHPEVLKGNMFAADDPGADRTERVESFAAGPLSVFALQIAGGYVVHAGVAENIVLRLPGQDVPGGPRADDDSQLALIVDVFGDRRIHDRVARGDQRGGWLEEDERLGRDFIAQLLSVV